MTGVSSRPILEGSQGLHCHLPGHGLGLRQRLVSQRVLCFSGCLSILIKFLIKFSLGSLPEGRSFVVDPGSNGFETQFDLGQPLSPAAWEAA